MMDYHNDGISKMLYAMIAVYMLTALEIKTRTSTGQWHQGWLPGVADTCVAFDVAFIHRDKYLLSTLRKLGYTLNILWEKDRHEYCHHKLIACEGDRHKTK